MVRAKKIERYKRMLGFQECFHNYSKKIRVFRSADYKINVLDDKEKQILLQISQTHGEPSFYIQLFMPSVLRARGLFFGMNSEALPGPLMALEECR